MSRRGRGTTTLSGILPIDKPAGMTSHDVVDAVRRATGEGRIGHAGTLDPMATGLLVVLVGPATRLEPYLSGAEKDYDARLAFGASTDTDDAEGTIIETAEVPSDLFSEQRAAEVLEGLLGAQHQIPPAYSAIKTGGTAAYKAARAGAPPTLTPRAITVHAAELLRTDADARTWDVRFHVSKGTYVRALARDIGRACGTVAHLSALRRTASGALTLAEHAHTLEQVRAAAEDGRLGELFADPAAALGLSVLDAEPALVAAGRPLPLPETAVQAGALVAIVAGDRLLAVYRAGAEALTPEAVIPGGVAGRAA
ncbi:MAG: tRNA pseudouridine(55) synthase TruB [Coriobacteriaceae bacterium]|nr:tRNA pseudouridine(55) synthase TruB [Coriobacteriaceae bacterium]